MGSEETGAGHHDEFGRSKPDSLQPGISPEPVPNCHIDGLALKVDGANARLYGNLDVGTEPREGR